MKNKVVERIKQIGVYGILHYGETQRFDDDKYALKENIYQYRISSIRVYTGENNSILGVQAFYKDLKGKEYPGAEGRDKTIKELDIKKLEIPPNDFLCNLNIWVGDDDIRKLKFGTKKGKELIVGTDDGEDRIISCINNNKDHIILSISGGYRKTLELLSCKYVPINEYLGPTMGYFELKKKLKNEDFKKKIEKKLDKLSFSDQVLFRTCCLPDNSFNEIIKFCLQ
jgi:hypothetical protein